MTTSGEVMAGDPGDAWEVLRQDVKGLRKDYSQDSHRAEVTNEGRVAVLAVADGHGSAAHFRSDLGARWAVEAFARCAQEFADLVVDKDTPEDERWRRLHELARELPRRVVRCWRQRVVRHECNAPADGRLRRGPGSTGSTGSPDYDVYGSTFVGAVLTQRLLVCWQLGDGDVALVWEDGRAEAPLYAGPDIGDETESLCQAEAWLRMRVHWQPLAGAAPPPAVLLSTDGLSKSFTDHDGFLGFASGVRERVTRDGTDAVRKQLTGWLTEAATHSGDDTTLVGAFPVPQQEGRARRT
jgi:hypothetical protein